MIILSRRITGMSKTVQEKTRIVLRFVGIDVGRCNRVRDRVFEAARRAERSAQGSPDRYRLMDRAHFLYSLDRVLAAHRIVILTDAAREPNENEEELQTAIRERSLAIAKFLNVSPAAVLP